MVFSRDGKILAVGEPGTTTRKDGRRHTTSRLSLRDPATGRKRNTFELHHDIDSLEFAPDGKTLAVGCFGGVRLVDAATGQELASFKGSNWATSAVAFSPDGKIQAAVGESGVAVVVWDVARRAQLAALDGHSSQTRALVFSPDGKTLATENAGTVMLWDATTWKRRASLGGQKSYVWVGSITFAPDGKTLASGHSDNTVKLWDAATGKELGTLNTGGPRVVSYSPDGRTLVTAGLDADTRVGVVKFWPVRQQEWEVVPGRRAVASTPAPPTAGPWPWPATFEIDPKLDDKLFEIPK